MSFPCLDEGPRTLHYRNRPASDDDVPSGTRRSTNMVYPFSDVATGTVLYGLVRTFRVRRGTVEVSRGSVRIRHIVRPCGLGTVGTDLLPTYRWWSQWSYWSDNHGVQTGRWCSGLQDRGLLRLRGPSPKVRRLETCPRPPPGEGSRYATIPGTFRYDPDASDRTCPGTQRVWRGGNGP